MEPFTKVNFLVLFRNAIKSMIYRQTLNSNKWNLSLNINYIFFLNVTSGAVIMNKKKKVCLWIITRSFKKY